MTEPSKPESGCVPNPDIDPEELEDDENYEVEAVDVEDE